MRYSKTCELQSAAPENVVSAGQGSVPPERSLHYTVVFSWPAMTAVDPAQRLKGRARACCTFSARLLNRLRSVGSKSWAVVVARSRSSWCAIACRLSTRPCRPGKFVQEAVQAVQDVGIGRAVPARLADSEFEQFSEPGPVQNHPDGVVVVVQESRAEVPIGEFAQQG